MKTWSWILGWSLSILTITGNGFIIFLVCSKRQLRTKTNTFIVSLALADFCVGMSVVPPMFFCEMSTGCITQSYYWVISVRLLFGYASVMNLCCLVLDRYIAVVKPLTYLTFMKRRRVIQMVSLAWGIPVAYRMIALLSRKISLFLTIIFWFTVIFFELLPCLILIVCFTSMLRVVCKHDRAARITAKQLRFNHHVLFKIQEKSGIKIMAIVIGLFLVCYGLYIRCSFIFVFNIPIPCNDREYKIPILVLNSAINPVAYAFYKRDIKNEIKRSICFSMFKKRNKVEPVKEENCFILNSNI